MKLELQSAANFLVHLIRLGRRNINETQLEKFEVQLMDVLKRRYSEHWFPEKPFKGSGYRCIRINGRMDPVLGQVAETCGVSPEFLHSIFPSELTMWIDPLEVSYRIGENGSICVLYECKKDDDKPSEAWKPSNSNIQSFKPPSPLTITSPDKKEVIKFVQTKAKEGLNRGVSPPLHTNPLACKESLRNMDYLLDPRKSVALEQLAAYMTG